MNLIMKVEVWTHCGWTCVEMVLEEIMAYISDIVLELRENPGKNLARSVQDATYHFHNQVLYQSRQ